nr:extracellular solute-binding protein [Janibacter alkaliphilus]
MVLAACGGSADTSDDSSTLTWYINPDAGGADPNGGGQAQLARECSEASGGAYEIRVELLPNSATDQRQQLLRRLAANDKGVDLMSMDPVFVAEFAEAGFLDEVPSELTEEFTADAVSAAVESAGWKGQLYASPLWANTQLLWYRKSVAQEAGLDMSRPVTWDQLIDAAAKVDTDIGVQASLYEGYTVWINAMIEGAGGQIVQNPGADAADLTFGLESPEGKEAAAVIESFVDQNVGGPALGSTDETTTLDGFRLETSSFMVNWIYVYSSLKDADPAVFDDLGWARYPRTVEGEESKPPLGGIEMGVNQASENKDASWEAVQCLTSQESQKAYMLGSGNPAARKAVYDDPEVREQFPMADLIRESLDAGAPRPLTQYYGDVSSGIQREYSPPGSVDPDTTPQRTTRLLQDVLNGDALL